MNTPRPNPRRQAAWFSFLRWTAVLVVFFVLTLFGYYFYVTVINRAPAEIYPVERGPGSVTVYGTFTISATNALTLFAQNAGYLHTDPTLGSTYNSQGISVKKDQLMATVVDENVERLVKQAQVDYDAAVSRKNNGPQDAGALKSAQGHAGRLQTPAARCRATGSARRRAKRCQPPPDRRRQRKARTRPRAGRLPPTC